MKDTTQMTNTQEDRAERWTAPLRELEARFKRARESILQVHPGEQVGDFGSMEGIETMRWDDLEILRITRALRVRRVEDRAAQVQAEVEEAEENRREQNMTEEQAWRRGIERSIAYLAAEITKLKGAPAGRLPALPHVARTNITQMLGQPGGMGRPAARGGSGGDARLLQRGADAGGSAPVPSTVEQGFTIRQHPLEVFGSSGRRG